MYALILFVLAGCQGNGPGDTGSNGSDGADGVDGADGSDGGTGFTARIQVAIPEMASTDVYVEANGAVAKCDAETRLCFYDVTEPGVVTVTADYEDLFFAPLTVMVTDEDADTTLATGWEVGGCSDPEWEVGDGFCSGSWTFGQVACDLSGYWVGVEEDHWDWESDLSMKAVDLDGDGQTDEVGVDGKLPFGPSTNGSGMQFYETPDSGSLVSGELVTEDGGGYIPATSCENFDAIRIHMLTVTGAKDEWHIRPI